MFDEIPARQAALARVREWIEIGFYVLTGFFTADWSGLLRKHKLLGLAVGAGWILLGFTVLWGLSGFGTSTSRPVRTKRYHLIWLATSAAIAGIASVGFSKNIFPYESALCPCFAHW